MQFQFLACAAPLLWMQLLKVGSKAAVLSAHEADTSLSVGRLPAVSRSVTSPQPMTAAC
jgi:hypothetical protein